MQLIDSHCHLDDARFDADRNAVIAASRAAGVNRFIVPAVTQDGWQKLQQMAMEHPEICPAYGLHPWFCDRHADSDLKLLAEYMGSAVAVGECGLDAGRCRTAMETQLHWFRAQLRAAADYGLPVIMHAVKTVDLVLKEIKAFPGLRGVVHSFSGSRQQADKLIDAGFYLGIGGAVTWPQNSRLRETVKAMPLKRLLIETDAPDQPPAGHRGKRNEPALLIEILDAVATLRGLGRGELAEICNANAKELFKL